MKRRDMILGSAGLLVPVLSRAAVPCPPPQAAVVGGTSVTTPCGIVATGSGYSTTFDVNENPLSEGGKWINGKRDGGLWNNVQSSSGKAGATHIMVTAPPYDDCIAHINPSFQQLPPNQFLQGTVFRAAGYTAGHEIELLARFSITPNTARGYEVYWSTNGGLYIVRWNGAVNDFTPLATINAGLANGGDVVRVEVMGTIITVKINGSSVLTHSDSTWSSGQPGIGLNPYGLGSDFYSYTWEDFSCGSL
jgi:hypothetical protein